jgi:hypothetical protein
MFTRTVRDFAELPRHIGNRLNLVGRRSAPSGKTDSKVQRRIREQLEDEMLSAAVIMEVRKVIDESDEEYVRGYLDGVELALSWKAAQMQVYERNHPELLK